MQNSFHSTITNDNGDELVMSSYSTKDTLCQKRIVVNDIDMSFEEFRGYLDSVGMPDEHELYEERRMNELKTVVIITSLIIGFGLLLLTMWATIFLDSIMKIQSQKLIC
jgi:hypothetical protein